jgi:hypothetical protein
MPVRVTYEAICKSEIGFQTRSGWRADTERSDRGIDRRDGRRGRPQLLASRTDGQPRRRARPTGMVVDDDIRPYRCVGGWQQEFVKGGSVVAGLQSHADAVATGPTYTFATPVLGGQAAFGMFAVPGNVGIDIDATLTGPRGRTISGSAHDERTTFSDVFYLGTLKWNNGVHNTMIYTTGNIPSGTYEANRLANLSLGFVAVDAGAGYTYLDATTGNEFSIVGGLTYNFNNPYNDYKNGIDSHIDWAASHFLSKNVLIGVVGYYFQQLTGDSGTGANLGDFKGRVVGIGPQIGFIFPAGEGYQGYLNLKAYKDLAVENRPEGYTA